MLPNFLIIGAQRSGTTTLWIACDRHPNIYMSPTRETAFFCNDGLYNRGITFYETTFFHEWSGQRAVGEKTPEYLLYPGTAARIRRLLPDARMVVTVRSPAERAHSNWRHNLMFGWESLPFREALDAEPDRIAANKNAIGRFGYLARGKYRRQLDQYYYEFDREQVHILLFDDLIADQAAALAMMYRFLGVEPVEGVTIHEGQAPITRIEVEGTGSNVTIRFKGRTIRQPSEQLRAFAEQYNKTLETLKPLSKEEAIEINRTMFFDDIDALSECAKRNLGPWLGKS